METKRRKEAADVFASIRVPFDKGVSVISKASAKSKTSSTRSKDESLSFDSDEDNSLVMETKFGGALAKGLFKMEKILVAPKKLLVSGSRDVDTISVPQEEEIPQVPPDTTLQNMNVILRKRLMGVTLQELYDIVWSESKEPFYEPWLSDNGTNDVDVEDWIVAETDGNKFVGTWCKEEYTQKRTVKIKFRRKTKWKIGPKELDIKHFQLCRREEDRLVVATTVRIRGVPIADAWDTEIRFVASQVNDDLLIEIGVFVNFLKPTILAPKIKTAVLQGTADGQTNFFEAIVQACDVEVQDAAKDDKDEIAKRKVALSWYSLLLVFFYKLLNTLGLGPPRILNSRNDKVAVEVRGADEKLRHIVSILEDSNNVAEQESRIGDEMDEVHKSLDKILLLLK